MQQSFVILITKKIRESKGMAEEQLRFDLVDKIVSQRAPVVKDHIQQLIKETNEILKRYNENNE